MNCRPTITIEFFTPVCKFRDKNDQLVISNNRKKLNASLRGEKETVKNL